MGTSRIDLPALLHVPPPTVWLVEHGRPGRGKAGLIFIFLTPLATGLRGIFTWRRTHEDSYAVLDSPLEVFHLVSSTQHPSHGPWLTLSRWIVSKSIVFLSFLPLCSWSRITNDALPTWNVITAPSGATENSFGDGFRNPLPPSTIGLRQLMARNRGFCDSYQHRVPDGCSHGEQEANVSEPPIAVVTRGEQKLNGDSKCRPQNATVSRHPGTPAHPGSDQSQSGADPEGRPRLKSRPRGFKRRDNGTWPRI